jgi:hypothetical protein
MNELKIFTHEESTMVEIGRLANDRMGDLEGYDTLDLMADIDKTLLDETGFEGSIDAESYESISEPHYLFDKEMLAMALRPLVTIIRDRQEVVAKTVRIEPTSGGVFLSVNSGEANTQIFVETLNTTNMLETAFIIEFRTLLVVLHHSGSRILIREQDGSPVVMVRNGEVSIDNYNLDKKLYEHSSFNIKMEDMARYDVPLFVEFLDRALKTMSLASRPEDRRLRLEKGRAFASYLAAIVSFDNVQISGISFRSEHLDFLVKFLSMHVEFYFKETEKHIVFRSGRSVVAFPKIDSEDVASVASDIDSFVPMLSFTVAPEQFFHILMLNKELIGGTGIVRLSTEDGQLRLKASTRTGKPLDFPIAMAPIDAKLSMSTPVASLIAAAHMLRTESVLQTEVSKENRLRFRIDGMQIIFGSIIS